MSRLDWSFVKSFVREAAPVPDAEWVSRKFDEFLRRTDPADAFAISGVFSLAHPFYVPKMSDAAADSLAISVPEFGEALMRARLTASRARQPNVLVACLPKSASTFIGQSLMKVLNVPMAVLMSSALSPQTPFSMGITLREQETDELALIQYGNNGLGYVAQHHLRCTPYLCRQLELYNIRPIVTYRNVYDSLVSLDDMMRKQQQEWATTRDKDAIYFSDGLPSNYCELDDETRYLILVDRQCAWYLQFFMSWKRCEVLGLVKPLWVSYEEDFLGNKQLLAERIATFVGPEFVDSAKLSEVFSETIEAGHARFNKGVSGRGRQLPQRVKDRIKASFDLYRDDFDFSEILPD
ncbi:hypothetical protein V6582_05065 [Agrobacterium vitis]|uniref:hypothetical protein n=1 Tax=Agrobacterium vitis TaxID=373 RepID=UPI0012E853BF|nr:hypothetical protein [Agrobacterium vitis]MVA27118.1 hypothetical protein [Agrobacterium vitis]